MSDNKKISIREFARRVGISDTAVHKAIKAGKISQVCLDCSNPKRPEIFPESALKEWGRNYAPQWNQSPALDTALTSQQALPDAKILFVKRKKDTVEHAPISGEFQDEPDMNEPGLIDPGAEDESDHIRLYRKSTLNEAKRVEAIAQAKLAQVKLAEQKGKLVSKDKVYKEFYDVGVRVRTALQGISDKIIDNVLACDTRNEAHSMLYGAITEALESLMPSNTAI